MNTSALISVRVQAMRFEAAGIVSVELVSPQGGELPAFEAGAHVDLHLPNGIVRSYSLLNSPQERHRYVVGVLNDRNSRGGSRYVHEQLRVGATIPISAPRNNFPLDESAAHSVLIAGGIGITPISCMFSRLRSLGKPAELLYCARSRTEAAFCDELLAQDGVQAHFDQDKSGPPDLRSYLASKPKDAHFYCCGPTPMLNAFESICEELGLPNVHIERFAATEQVEAVQGSDYVAYLERTKKSITVPAGKSLLDALLEAGMDVDHSCREGVCGACETKVLDGIPEHRDGVLSKAERASNKTMMVCVSGCRGQRLVLDL
ncbi:PDR/VanB family oxidoreductase [Noviherbaspirillum saxi]|uniref:Oxidoreductase n=1 Tax=Noviherbaspirillum saxi TaxID=2320863 RepID=A0A3A3FGJ4_9BURK|nr:PDR/VanB family oxidoreductase [Noviherbaspirillum saxi]RJF92237.1 oxidoreductase [Noviherbaspirillum saxi]